MHKHKNSLRIATRIFNEATAVKPQVAENQVEYLTKGLMGDFDKYTEGYQRYVQRGNHELIYNCRNSPESIDDMSRWIDHLI